MARKPEFEATVYRAGDYLGSGTLKLPFTWSEYRDALEKAWAADGRTPVTIELNYAQRAFLRPYTVDINDGILSDTRELLELNLLARRLEEMSEDAPEGLEAMILLEERESGRPIPVARLINMTYEADGCVRAGNVRTHAELGRFLFENDMAPEDILEQTVALTGSFDAEIPEEWLALVGRRHMEANGGVFTGAGYFECPAEIPEVYKPGETVYFDRSGAPVVLEAGDPRTGESVTLDLPITEDELAAKLQRIGASSMAECVWRCADCLIPAAKEWIAWEEDFEKTNRFAGFLKDLERRETPERYKALLQAAGCSGLEDALRLGSDLDAYTFHPDQATPAHYGKAALYEIYGEETADALCPYMDCFKYGQAMMDLENAVNTDYGFIRRTDAEPIQAPEESEAEDIGMGGPSL
jgi:hypothetical protein